MLNSNHFNGIRPFLVVWHDLPLLDKLLLGISTITFIVFALASDVVTPRAKLSRLSKEADAIHAAAYSDALAVTAAVREGGDPGVVGVRSPRSGRREPGPGVDLVTEARPMSKTKRWRLFRTLQHAVDSGDVAVTNTPAKISAKGK